MNTEVVQERTEHDRLVMLPTNPGQGLTAPPALGLPAQVLFSLSHTQILPYNFSRSARKLPQIVYVKRVYTHLFVIAPIMTTPPRKRLWLATSHLNKCVSTNSWTIACLAGYPFGHLLSELLSLPTSLESRIARFENNIGPALCEYETCEAER